MCCTGNCPCEDPFGSCRLVRNQPYPDDAACNPDAPYPIERKTRKREEEDDLDLPYPSHRPR